MSWMGHTESDELSAFYKMNRSNNFEDFRSSFETYGVSAQNFLYADREGNVGHVLAYRQPLLKDLSEISHLVKSKTNKVVGFKSSKNFLSC